jgi:3-oxoacyl-[acyl-carrier protein] reductase
MSLPLQGKAALVTGGSRGIGAAIAKKLAQDGADVALTYTSAAGRAQAVVAEIEAAGRRGLAIAADNRDAVAIEAAVEEAAAAFGRLDILVNNAGIYRAGTVEELTLEDFDAIVRLDLRAAFVGSKAALKHLRDGGRIVFISSNIADYAALPMTSLYCMVKRGLDGLCKGMARDLGPKGITVNSVHPGPIATDANPQDGPYGKDLKRLMATPRFGTPLDVGALVAFLASPQAGFISGSIHHVDNGFTA